MRQHVVRRCAAELVLRDSQGLDVEGLTEAQKDALQARVRLLAARGEIQALAQPYQPPQLLVQLAELPAGPNVRQRLLM